MVHNFDMRISINLDDDVYQYSLHYAAARGITLGAAVGELVRKSHREPDSEFGLAMTRSLENGLQILVARGRQITAKMVKSAQEDENA